MWRHNFGQPAGTLPNDSSGVAIGQTQYDMWRSNYGTNSGFGSGAGSSLTKTAVPEPCAILLALIGGIVMIAQRRRSH